MPAAAAEESRGGEGFAHGEDLECAAEQKELEDERQGGQSQDCGEHGSAGTMDWAINSAIQETSRLLPSAIGQVLWPSE